MNNRRMVTVMLVSLVLVAGWYYANIWVRQHHPEWFPPPQPASTQPSTAPSTQIASQPTSQPMMQAATPQAAPPVEAVSALRVEGETGRSQPAELGHRAFDPQGQNAFPIGLVISPRGASLDSVTLNRFRQTVKKDDPYVFQQPYNVGNSALARALATQAEIVNGTRQDLSSIDWRRVSASESAAEYAVKVSIPGSDKALTITKKFELRPAGDATAGYEVRISYALKNETGQPLNAQLVYNGPNIPTVETNRDYPEVVSGHNRGGSVEVAHNYASNYSTDKSLPIETAKTGPILWTGVTSAYFSAIVRPPMVDGKSAQVQTVNAQAVAPGDKQTGQQYTNLTFQTPTIDIPAGQSASMPLEVYLGPRWRAVLGNEHYQPFPLSYAQILVLTSGPFAFCTFGWLINVLVKMLTAFHWLFGGFAKAGDWGLAIIALVIVVRLLLHPITKRSQISMSKMGKMGPEVERLKKKYGDNKEELNKAMMSVYKEQGITPILGCLPMMLQMPIWIALWSALQSTFELRQAPFLWGFTWIHDLSQPDRLIGFSPITLWFLHLDGVNILPILMGVVFYLQQKMTPKPPAMTPEQEQQQKMMQWMSLLFPLLLYPGPSGLNLYILTSTAIGIWESKRVRDHLKAQEEAEKAGRVIVDAKPTRASRRHARADHPEGKKTGLAGWLASLQRMADDMRDRK